MNRFVVILISVFWAVSVSAQQIPVSTIFVENPFAFNPAVAGSDNGFKVRLNSRMQWLGFGDGPVTNVLSAYGPTQVRNMGYGGSLMVDQTGPVSMIKGSGGYAINIFITSDIRASLGLNVGFIQYSADGSQFELFDDGDDPKAQKTKMSSFKPDAGAGIYIYHYDWFVGASAQQLFNNNIKFTNEGEDKKLNRLKTHFYGYGGYRITMMGKMKIEPSILARKVAALPMQLDINARVIYDQTFWGGISARNTFESFDDLSLIFGYIHERRYYVSIAYDFTFANIRKYTAGTIELVLGYNFDDVKHGR